MKLIVFGATGGIGRLIVSGALELGHAVTAFVRNPQSLEARDGLRVVQGDIFDPQSVGDAIEEASLAGAVARWPSLRPGVGDARLGEPLPHALVVRADFVDRDRLGHAEIVAA